MFYERRLRSLAAIVSEASSMDADAGIRVSGSYGGRKCYAFVTRFGPRYTLMIYERKSGKLEGLGRNLASEDIEGLPGLRAWLKKVATGRFEAFAY